MTSKTKGSRSADALQVSCSASEECEGAIFLGGFFMQCFGLSDDESFPALSGRTPEEKEYTSTFSEQKGV